MTRIAAAVGLDRLRVRLRGIESPPLPPLPPAGVAARAVPGRGMMLLVTGRAADHTRVGVQRNGGRMTLRARDVRVSLVLERDGAPARGMIRHADRNHHLPSRGDLVRTVTTRAVTRRRALVMARETPARRRECQLVGPACRRVAGDAGELLVAVVGEGIRSREPGAGSRGCPWRVGVAFAFFFRIDIEM